MSYEPITASELYELFLISEDGNEINALNRLNDLHSTIQNNHYRLLGNMEDFKKSKTEDLHVCPRCFNDLQTVYDGEEISECQGFNVGEKQYSIICTECDYSKEIDD